MTQQTPTTTNEASPRLEIQGDAPAKDTPRGKITMSEDVVATIAGLAAREVQGIHSLGKWRLIAFGENPARGVDAEIGSRQAAFDIDAVVEYGSDIQEVAKLLRSKIAAEVRKMAGREVVEVNINIVGLHMPDEEARPIPGPTRRVL
ncbi:Asp23/Gls24 family envelope stress response protein [Myxococcota bacterium]